MYNINNICYQRHKKSKEVWELNVTHLQLLEAFLSMCLSFFINFLLGEVSETQKENYKSSHLRQIPLKN